MQGWEWRRVHHPDHIGRVPGHIQRAFETGEPWEDTFPLRGRDGQYRWFLSRAVPIRDKQEQVIRWFGTNTDVTGQREWEERVRHSEQRFRLLVDTAATIVWTTDPVKGEFRGPQPRWSAFTGQSFEQARGMGWLEAIHPEDRAQTFDAWRNAAATRSRYQVEHRLRRADGAWRHMDVHSVPVLDERSRRTSRGAPGWACRSRRRSAPCSAATSRWKAGPGKAAPSPSACQAA